MIPVIDIFAGPGGLSEGFSSVRRRGREKDFDIRLSIEKDPHAYATLRLRAFFWEFKRSRVPHTYYDFLRGGIPLEGLYRRHPIIAEIAAMRVCHAELGAKKLPQETIRQRIDAALDRQENWVLIGGPPCQAYSVAGRSRNRGKKGGYDPGKDIRHKLYLEYLQIISDHWPAMFVMENVKGLLSATLDNQLIFRRIVEDLENPRKSVLREGRPVRRGRAHRYRIYSFVRPTMFTNGNLNDSVIHAEYFGVPQARHRVILLGIRDDLGRVTPKTLAVQEPVPLLKVLASMPRVRSGVSRQDDDAKVWTSILRDALKRNWYLEIAKGPSGAEIQSVVRQTLRDMAPPPHDRGGDFIEVDAAPDHAQDWFIDPRLDGVCHHTTRLHMPSDLYRYLFASCFAKVHRRSPTLRDMPKDILPNHHNVNLALEEHGHFSDRFRVQVEFRPATTITSHISKDGHYYIHYDPMQCRSLTVREAARVQTFPDNYCFLGPRTAQYTQVGNAVPPLLARQLAEITLDVLIQAGMAH